MEKNEIDNKKASKNLSQKIFLAFCPLLSYSFKNDPLLKLLMNYLEIVMILKLPNYVKFFYFAFYCIHRILYESDEVINIPNSNECKNLSFLFYLTF